MEDMAKKRPLSANDIADWFINMVDREAGDTITHSEVQKLVFFAQAWFLGNKGRELFAEDFEAWASGPVCRAIHDRFGGMASQTIPAIDGARVVDGEKLELLRGVHAEYACFRSGKLEEFSKEPGGPWAAARGAIASEAGSTVIITKDSLRRFYGEKIGKTWK